MQYGKRRKCWLPTFLPFFHTTFSRALRCVENGMYGKGLTCILSLSISSCIFMYECLFQGTLRSYMRWHIEGIVFLDFCDLAWPSSCTNCASIVLSLDFYFNLFFQLVTSYMHVIFMYNNKVEYIDFFKFFFFFFGGGGKPLLLMSCSIFLPYFSCFTIFFLVWYRKIFVTKQHKRHLYFI